MPADIDGDGDMDIIAGNLGQNSRLQASAQEPVRMYFNDFDDNGKKEQIVTFYVNHKEITLSGKDEIQKQIPLIKKKFIYAADFAKASLSEIFTSEKINNAVVSTADYFSNAVFINNGNFNFTIKAMPWQAQLSCYRSAVLVNANNDNLPDILLAGNYYSNNIHKGRNDADFGTLLVNNGNGNFSCQNLNGLLLKGEIRHLKNITISNKAAFIAAKNNEALTVFQFNK